MHYEKPLSTGQAVVAHLGAFDPSSGNRLERAIFNHRPWIVLACLLVTLLLGWQSTRIEVNASFEKSIPGSHPYILNFLAGRTELSGLGNALRIAVEVRQGDIFNREYLDTLAKINDEIYLLPGVDRPYMKSLWTPTTRWTAVTEEGLDGGTVIPDDYDGSPQSLERVRANIARSGEIGQLVAANFKSSVIFVPLLDVNPQTGAALDYGELSRQLEALRAKYQSDQLSLHVTGFAKIIGDLIEGLAQVAVFFLIAVLVTVAVLLAYTRCPRSTLIVVTCSLVAVLWQLGLLASLGYPLDPYSALVPFLVFAIGMSHGAQKMNGIMQDIGRGTHRVVAARYTFRRLFAAGITALLCDLVGFVVLLLIDIQSIRDLAISASLGVAVLVFTNLILLPVLLSYLGVSPKAAARSLRAEVAGGEPGAGNRLWALLLRFTAPPAALLALGTGLALAVLGFVTSLQLQVGDLDPGAPELRADSRYNRDAAFMTHNYGASSDIFVIMVRTGEDQCTRYTTLAAVDELATRLERLPGVEATASMAALSRIAGVGYNEGNLKWYELIPNDGALGAVQTRAPRELFNQGCSWLSLYVYLADHKAQTLERVVAASEAFIAERQVPGAQFLLAAGSAGIEAATNIVVRQSMREMLFWVYGAVAVLCLVTFRSWRATLCALLPLMLTSVLCEALMVALGMGVKVATLPVIALGVGIGIDYALYVLSVLLARLRAGDTLAQAYHQALLFTGKVVLLTGVTLSVAVATWAFSPIKFQADMGVLLAFMFLVNMLGALILLPALAWLLLRSAPRPLAS
ncbi:MMPL family transporter [Pseudomonas sp. DTU_2021_1001937_2_SI_NGA_ILE_001]|uniref:efflux RND transporter permease subunit n=1 Tax=Pseudomonas sp. DTU_2021_1001937_2_SI_NGA_ILE_001 TaxID=3077589 RepID=UPI0028FC2585|nr:MMPL family transporter [Pseudomonas sp. DTU_2021_1001937_2_SI_NGA_ILE_001]WNW11191.1 MMPL family transporter [Pseudomonas sp. DTU_2021_1001937_2_SI_NGA_ILE_001]